MNAAIRTTQDENNQHAVVIVFNGQARVYSRHYCIHVISATKATVRRDGNAVKCWEESPVAEYRATKSGRRMLVAAK